MSALLEGLPCEQKFRSQGRTIGEGDLALLTNLTWTTSELHTNAEHMKQTPFGERMLAGPCVVACMVGLAGTSGFRQALHAANARLLAMLGMENVRFTAPVLPGDTVWVETEIADARETSSPKRGVMRIQERGYKQTGEQVCEYLRIALFERTP
ncbi:MAG: MaoC family dehydratase N-terminal domain-containing protein [Chloroflexi bacterium]|nr:MaoC family dehydratase N-terminal domain-containing protein [Chloroflexota bacterium]